jgi:hypothetical protein
MAERRLQRFVAIALVPVAIACAGALIALRLHFQPPRVPGYALVGDDGGEQTLAPGGTFHVELRATSQVEGAVGARAFLVRDEKVRPWDPPFEVTRDGTVTLDGPVNTLFAAVPAGSWEVAVAVGRPEVLPTAPNDVLRERRRDAGPDASWRLVVLPIRLERTP